MIPAFLLLAAQAATPGDNPVATMAPATAAAIRAGGKACIGATTDPAGEAARLAGWADATPAQKQAVHGDGRVVQRDNVLVIVKPGKDGGCVVMAKLPADFDQAAFYADFGRDIGRTIATDPQQPVTQLGGGEVLVTTMVTDPQSPMAVLVVGNTGGKAAKNKGKP